MDKGGNLCKMRFLSPRGRNARLSHLSHRCLLLMNSWIVSIAKDDPHKLTDD